MKHLRTVILAMAVVSMLVGVRAWAQAPTHQHDAGKQAPGGSARPSTPGHGMEAHMMQHMEMCRHMMGQGGMMGGGMMGMPVMMGGDPKQQAEMMAMRGEMMKAMGEIMLKYAQRAQPGK
jgi:hypothetical protein